MHKISVIFILMFSFLSHAQTPPPEIKYIERVQVNRSNNTKKVSETAKASKKVSKKSKAIGETPKDMSVKLKAIKEKKALAKTKAKAKKKKKKV